MATKPRGGGLKALVTGPLRKELFLRLLFLTLKMDVYKMSGNEPFNAGYRSVQGTDSDYLRHQDFRSIVQVFEVLFQFR